MSRITLVAIILTGSILAACASKSMLEEKAKPPQDVITEIRTATREPWETAWQKAQIEAKKEGKVIIYTTVAPITRTEVTNAFKKKYDGIELEFVPGSGPELSQKILTQRRAGLYLVDLYIAGATSMVNVLKPMGVFDPFDSVLILPQVSDPKVWWEGRFPFLDKDHTIISITATHGGGGALVVNSEVIKPEEIKSYYNLLDIKYKDKIVMMDPTIAGKGQQQMVIWATQTVLGWDYFKELVKQRPVLTRDARLQMEWITQKKYFFGFSPHEGLALEFVEAGAPIKVFGALKEDIPWVIGAYGQTSLVNRAPHSNATKVFANWLLDREGQEIWSRTTMAQSARVDVDAEHMIKTGKPVRQAGVSYYMVDNEEHLSQNPERQKTIIEIFGTVTR